MKRESRFLEYTLNISKNFLKTVSAFANYGTGKIIFGISDSFEIKGVTNPIGACLDIKNMINDNILPRPSFSLEINNDNTITLTVNEGLNKPYLYNNKAYKRSDSSTVEVDRQSFMRLILEGSNKAYEELDSKDQNLSFDVLKDVLTKKLGLKKFNDDTLKTLQLMNFNGLYNNAGALFADNNSFKGIDIVRFGNSLNEITNRVTLENVSILTQFQKATELFDLYYVVEVIEGFERKKKELIPRNAFREAVANALVHRLYDVDANIKISMFSDKIEISSPGGLLNDLSKEDYIRGGLSILRNPIIGNIFYRLNYIEKFGTGIRKINACYDNSLFKPSYSITDTTISVTLPLITNDLHLNLNEQKVINSFNGVKVLARKEIEELTGLSKSQVIRVLNSLMDKKLVSTSGTGPSLKYHLM